MSVPNPKDIKEEKIDWEEHERRYPKQKHQCKEGKLCRPANGLTLKVGQSITDIPVEERHRYMWIVPDEMKDHQMYKEKDWGGRIIQEREEKKCCEEKEKKKKEEDRDRRERDREKNDKDKDDAIQLLLKHVSELTKQVNELTKQMKK